MRLMLPMQPVLFSCPATGETRRGTIKDTVRRPSLCYRVEAAGGVVLTLDVGQVLPIPRRPLVEREHVLVGVKGGQDRAGAELYRQIDTAAAPPLILAAVGVGIATAKAIAWLATAAGPLFA